ncbi:MAG: YncE family protein [Bacteroidota bacterium]|nr:YncE family protein [Bacteroidota bacterium]
MKKASVVFLLVLLILGSCKKDKSSSAPVSKGVYISNEGNFTFGNGEVSFYDPATQQVSNNLFKGVNGYSLGDVAQSVYIKDSIGFIVVNNSQKIEMVRIPSFQKIRTISIPNSSPRYVLAVNDSIIYVTELYKGKVYVINYQTGNVVKTIDQMASWTEHMVQVGNYVVVEERNADAHPSATSTLATINVSTNTFAQRYTYAGTNINGIVKDNLNRIWLAVASDSANIRPGLTCLNGDMSVAKTITFPYGHNPSNLCINGSGDRLYFFDSDIESISVDDTVALAAPFAANGGRNLYGMGVDPVTGDVYASDALDYVQASRIYRYDKNGVLIGSFIAGVISGNFAFSH